MKQNDGQTQRGANRRYLRGEHRARSYRQRSEHLRVTTIRKYSVPTQHGEEAHDEHGRRDQKMLSGHIDHEAEKALGPWPVQHKREVPKHGTDIDKKRCKLPEQLGSVALSLR